MKLRISPDAHFMAFFVTLASCMTFLTACEAIPTEEEVVEKELAGKVSMGIRPIKNLVLSEESMEVLFYLNNATDTSITILPWATPLESSMTADRFEISIDGKVMPYSGRVVKRPAPRAEDFIRLAPGEKKEAVVALADGYDVGDSGDYEIALREFVFQTPESDFLTPAMLEQSVAITRQ